MRKIQPWFPCLMAYLAVWAIFGFAYWIVGKTPENYVVQPEILLEHKVHYFLANREKPSRGLKEAAAGLFAAYGEEDGGIEGWGISHGPVPHFTTEGYTGIGEAWAAYYCAKYRDMDADRFAYTVQEGFCSRYFHIEVSLYPWTGQNPIAIIGLELPKESFDTKSPPDSLKDLLAASVFYPDGDILIFWQAEQEGHRLALADFLYFSAVTLATLGYGDIVPNCLLARGLVLLETFLGMTLLAIFASSFYDFLRKGLTKEK